MSKKTTNTTKKVVPNKAKSISRQEAIKLIENSSGRFMTLTCDTATKKNRKMNCIFHSTMPTGRARVKEIGAGFKSADYRTLSELKINKQVYTVK